MPACNLIIASKPLSMYHFVVRICAMLVCTKHAACAAPLVQIVLTDRHAQESMLYMFRFH